MSTTTFEQIVERIDSQLRQDGFIDAIKRQPVDYSYDIALQALKQIGLKRSPSFTIDDNNRVFYENAVRWALCSPNLTYEKEGAKVQVVEATKDAYLKGFYLAGKTGTGKSWALENIFMLCYVLGVKVMLKGKPYCFAQSFIKQAKQICLEYELDGVDAIAQYQKMPILAIQDFGSEVLRSGNFSNAHNVLREILEYRADQNGLLTFITSNLRINSEHLKEAYGDRMADRLAQMCNYYILRGESRRNY